MLKPPLQANFIMELPANQSQYLEMQHHVATSSDQLVAAAAAAVKSLSAIPSVDRQYNCQYLCNMC